MIKKIEAWFRKLLSSELRVMESAISGLEVKLDKERKNLALRAEDAFHVLEFESARLLQEFKQNLASEAAVVLAEKNKLIAELHEKVAALEETTHKIAHWKADSSTVEADHSLKLVK